MTTPAPPSTHDHQVLPSKALPGIFLGKEEQVMVLCQDHHVKSLWVFGSAVTDRFLEDSDVDLLVEFVPDFFKENYGEYADNYFNLLFAFEDLFRRKVDLVMAGASENPYFLQSLNRQKQLVYGG
jgi:uncharacterized protein